MLLKDKFYSIVSKEQLTDNEASFTLKLLPECDCYRGHFPGNPVSPGVCNIITIKECAEELLGKTLRYDTIKLCRLTAIATPTVCPEVTLKVSATPNADATAYTLAANICDATQGYMDLKATVKVS